MTTKTKHCFECRNGEHDNYTEEVSFCEIRMDGAKTRRGYLCHDHFELLVCDGYIVTPLRDPPKR